MDFRERIMTYCRERAAQAWCTETTRHLEMSPELAEQFAKILASEICIARDYGKVLQEFEMSGRGAKKD